MGFCIDIYITLFKDFPLFQALNELDQSASEETKRAVKDSPVGNICMFQEQFV